MNTLLQLQVGNTLASLHQKAEADHENRSQQRAIAAKQGNTLPHGWATAYSAVSAEEGKFLNFLVVVSGAKTIVEFGCSFGISTIYLAAAAKDNGGNVTTSDFEPTKVAGATQNIADAGLGDVVQILQGDAIQTLAAVEGPIDFLFLDGAKDLYLPIFQMLRSRLSSQAIIVADNADQPGTRSFVDFISNAKEEFSTVQLFGNRALVIRLNS